MSRAHQDAPPRRPPPPPRPPHHATAARPVAVAAWPPLVPPRPPFPMTRPPPLPMLPWPPAPPRFPMRPPVQHAPCHHSRPPPPVFPRFVPPYRPPLPSQDPDASWLAAFTDTHLHAAPVTDTPSTCDPPLRPIRERLGEMLSKLDELEALAHELVETEQKISTMDSSTDDLAVARLKAQAERKRHQCEQLRGALDKLQDPRPFGIGPEKYRDTLAFTKHIQKKEAYRLRRKEKGRAEHAIRQRLQNQHETKKNEEVLLPVPEEADTLGHAADDTPVDAVDGQQRDDGRVVSTRRDRHRECEAARKVLLALDLRELRKGAELTEHERHEIDEARGLATECLRRKRRRKRPRASKTRDTDTVPPPSPTLVSSVAVGFPRPSHGLPLRDPFATDMETLIDLRRRWDFFLAPPTVHGASAIPPHFVPPPTNPTAPWAAFIVQ